MGESPRRKGEGKRLSPFTRDENQTKSSRGMSRPMIVKMKKLLD
jgi:hypothetical protein